VIVVPQDLAPREVADALVLIWAANAPDDMYSAREHWRNCAGGGVTGQSESSCRGGVAYSSILRSRSALAMTETELKVMAALAIIGLSSSPVAG